MKTVNGGAKPKPASTQRPKSFHVPNSLKARAGSGPARLDPERAKALDRSIERYLKQGQVILESEIDTLLGHLAPLDGQTPPGQASLRTITRHARKAWDAASLCGQALVVKVTAARWRLAEDYARDPSPIDLQLLTLYAQLLAAVRRDGIEGDGGEMGRQLMVHIEQAAKRRR